MTPEERHLWYDFLKDFPIQFKRQKVIGPYIVDFYCAAAKIVIELDGSQHYKPDAKAADIERDEYFEKYGITVLRYSNKEVNENFGWVTRDITKHIQSSIDKENYKQ